MRTISDGWATHHQERALPNALRIDPKFTPRSGSRIRAAQAPGLDLEGHYADRSGLVSHDEDYHIKTVAALHETLSAVGVGSHIVIPSCVHPAIVVAAHLMLWDFGTAPALTSLFGSRCVSRCRPPSRRQS